LYIPNLEPHDSQEHRIKGFLSFDKCNNQIYDNLFLDDCKIVVKVSIPQNPNLNDAIKIIEFSLSNSIFLISY